MKYSIFSSLFDYLKNVFSGISSLFESCFTVFPYFFGIGELRKEITEQYPDPVSSRTENDLPQNSRGFIFNNIDRCTGCKDCEKICPTKCIYVENEFGPDPTKIWVSVFNIDFSQCVFCGLCVKVCQPVALVQTRQFEGAVYNLAGLKGEFGRGGVTSEQRKSWLKIREDLDDEEY